MLERQSRYGMCGSVRLCLLCEVFLYIRVRAGSLCSTRLLFGFHWKLHLKLKVLNSAFRWMQYKTLAKYTEVHSMCFIQFHMPKYRNWVAMKHGAINSDSPLFNNQNRFVNYSLQIFLSEHVREKIF